MVPSGPTRTVRVWVLLLIVGFIASPGRAQEPPTFELPEVVVPGKRPQAITSTPASVTVISRADLDRLAVRTVADALRLVPELTVRPMGGLGSLALPSLRGSTPAQVLVLLDGVPLNNVALGQADLSTISTDGVERIEVLRGPFAALYGSGALGGVINIVTARPRRGEVLVSGGSLEGSVHAELGEPGEATTWQIALSADSTRGHRINSDYAGTTVIAKVTFSPTFRGSVHHFDATLGTPGDVGAPTPTDRQAEVRTLTQVGWGREDKVGSTGRLYYLADRLVFSSPFGSSVFTSALAGGEVQQVWLLDAEQVITGGLELQHQTLNASVFGFAIVRESAIGGAYVQYDGALSPQLLASLGMRVDEHSAYGGAINPRAGVVYHLSEETRIRAAVGRTFRGPTFLELYFPGCSNPNLRPEYAWAGEVGIERSVEGVVLAASVFGTEVRDLIVGGCNPMNIGSAAIRGITGELRIPAGLGWSVVADVTVQRAIDQTSGAPILRVPDLTAHLALTYQSTPSSLITLTAEYVGARPDMDFSVFPPVPVQMPSYIELRMRYQVATSSEWTITAGVNNLLDQPYEAVKGFPVPGRTLFVTATQRF